MNILSQQKRCWNCTQYAGCQDYRTFAFGCLSCNAHEAETNVLKMVNNLVDFANLQLKGPVNKKETESSAEGG